MLAGPPSVRTWDRAAFTHGASPEVRAAATRGAADSPPTVIAPSKAARRTERGRSDQHLLISVDPPLQVEGNLVASSGINSFQQLVIGLHLATDTLFPVSRWPLSIRAFALLWPLRGDGSVASDQLAMITWGEIYRDLSSANNRFEHSKIPPQ